LATTGEFADSSRLPCKRTGAYCPICAVPTGWRA